MDFQEIAGLEQRVATLHSRLDGLLAKLAQADSLIGSLQDKVDELPSEDYWSDYCRRLPSGSDLQEFEETWERLPSEDDLRKYVEASAGLKTAG